MICMITIWCQFRPQPLRIPLSRFLLRTSISLLLCPWLLMTSEQITTLPLAHLQYSEQHSIHAVIRRHHLWEREKALAGHS